MGKIEQNKEKKRIAIITAAQDVFFNEGYVGASMDSIAVVAGVTKQTVYRYFSSKEVLFDSMLKAFRDESGDKMFDHLNAPDIHDALSGFGFEFIKAHLSKEHLAIVRLIVAEGANAPELLRSFTLVGPSETAQKLDDFFGRWFQMKNTDFAIRMWTSMLLSMRTDVLMGRKRPTQKDIREYANSVASFLLKSLSD